NRMLVHIENRRQATMHILPSQPSRRSRWLRAAIQALIWSAGLAALAGRAMAAPGQLDPSFGTSGLVLTNFGRSEAANGIAIQRDGKVVVAGVSDAGTDGADFAVARYNPDGSLDTTFGPDHTGKVITPFGDFDAAAGVAIQRNGKIVVAGVTNAG